MHRPMLTTRGPSIARAALLLAAFCIFTAPRIARAQQPDVETQWRALDDDGKLDAALGVARAAIKAAARGTRAYWLARILEADTIADKGDGKGASASYADIDRGIRATLGSESDLRGRVLVGQATLLVERDEFARALTLAKDARRLLTPVGTSDAGVAAVVLEAILYYRLEQYADALIAATDAAALARAASPPDEFQLLRALAVQANVARERRDFANARARRDEIVTRLAAATLTDLRRADVLAELANVTDLLGDAPRALDWARTVVDERKRVYGPDSLSVRDAQTTRGAIATGLGLGAEAVDALEDALRITRMHDSTAETLALEENDVGAALADIGRFVDAQAHLRAGEAALRGARPGAVLGSVWGNLGSLDFRRGYYQGAQRWLQRSRAALASRDRESRRALVATTATLGQLAMISGRSTEALQIFGTELTLATDVFGPEHAQVAISLSHIAEAEMDEGRWSEAKVLLTRAIEILSNELGPDDPALVGARTNLAISLAWAAGTTVQANDELGRAMDAETRKMDALLSRARPDDIRRSLRGMDFTTSLATWLALRPGATPDVVRRALGAVLTRKALDLDVERARARALRAAKGDGAGALLTRLGTARAALARALVRGAPTADEIVGMERDIDALELQVSTLADGTTRAAVRVVDPNDVVKALPPHAALVELSLFKPYTRSVQGTALTVGAYHIAAYVLGSDGAISVTDLGGVELIGGKVTTARAAVQGGSLAAAELHDLYSLSVAPWEAHVASAAQLFIAPDGPLTLLPFEILPRPDGTTLLGAKRISYLTSGRDLLDLGDPPPLPTTLGSALLVGDADYDFHDPSNGAPSASPGSLAARARWPKLPGTAQEIQSLARALPGATVLLGAKASVTAVEHVDGVRMIHLATHGFFLDPQGGLVASSRGLALELAPEDGDKARNAAPSRAIAEALSDAPLIRSGLILAGANANGVGIDDGYLTASELESLPLSATELVVLSACETGVGETTAGLGVMGLRRSLALAGARSQVMSLWKVDDAATAELMIRFYANLATGAPRVDALRSAKLAILARPEWRAPAFWGAFQLFGDWRPMVAAAAGTNAGAAAATKAQLQLPPSTGCGRCAQAPSSTTDTRWGVAASLAFFGVVAMRLRRRRVVVVALALLSFAPARLALAQPQDAVDAITLNDRATNKSAQGKQADALALYRRALLIEPDNDYYLANAASACMWLKDYKGAHAYFEAAIDAALTVHGFERAQTYSRQLAGIVMLERADIARAQQDAIGAPLNTEGTQAFGEVEALLGEARALLLQGRPSEAVGSANRAIAICVERLPQSVLCLARARATGALAAASGGDASGVKPATEAVLALAAVVGKDNPEVLTHRVTLSSVLEIVGKRPEAIVALEGVVADASRRFGRDNPLAISAQANLVNAYAHAGRSRDVSALALRTIEPCHRTFGKHSELCMQLLRAVAQSEYAARNYAVARGAAARAMVEQLAVYGTGGSGAVVSQDSLPAPEHPGFTEIVDTLTRIELGNAKQEPMNVYAARLRVLEQYVGADAISTVRTELYLAQLELKAGKIDVAARRLLDAQRRVSASYGASSPTALEVSMVVTKWLAGVGRYAEIEALTVDTNRRENDVLGAKSETSIVASFNEGFVKAHLGRPDGFGIASDAAKRASDVLGSTDPTAVHMRETLPSLQGK